MASLKTKRGVKGLKKPVDQRSVCVFFFACLFFLPDPSGPLGTWRAGEPAIYRNHIPPHLPFFLLPFFTYPTSIYLNALASFHLRHLSYQVPTLSQSSCFSPLLWFPLLFPSVTSLFFYRYYLEQKRIEPRNDALLDS